MMYNEEIEKTYINNFGVIYMEYYNLIKDHISYAKAYYLERYKKTGFNLVKSGVSFSFLEILERKTCTILPNCLNLQDLESFCLKNNLEYKFPIFYPNFTKQIYTLRKLNTTSIGYVLDLKYYANNVEEEFFRRNTGMSSEIYDMKYQEFKTKYITLENKLKNHCELYFHMHNQTSNFISSFLL